jgi:AbiV family abortive infection protein
MVKCETCGREIAPSGAHDLQEDVRKEETYCACIPWETMTQCVGLSLANARRLAEDADFLCKAKRLSSASVLAILSIEESGKALLGCKYLVQKRKISVNGRKGDYQKDFLNHQIKMKKAIAAAEAINPQLRFHREVFGREFTEELLSEKLQCLFVDYDGKHQVWRIPWSQNPDSFLKEYDYLASIGLLDLKKTNDILKAQESICKVWTERVLIRTAKAVIGCAQDKFESSSN